MLGFQPQQMHYDLCKTQHNLDHYNTQDIEETPRYTCYILIVLRDKNRYLAADALAYIHYQRSKNERRQRLPKERNLVIVRSHVVDHQRRRKFEGCWLGPRILVSYKAARLLAYVREVYGVEKPKRYHLDDLLFYAPCNSFRIRDSVICQGLHRTTPTVIGGHGMGEPRARTLFLNYSYCNLR